MSPLQQPLTLPNVWSQARVFVIEGDNAAEFLQGYLTCDCRRLAQTNVLPMAICNIKGRVIASGWALQLDHAIGLLVHDSLLETVAAFLKPYITFSKCSADPAQALWVSVSEAHTALPLGDAYYLSLHQEMPSSATDISAQMNQWLITKNFAFVSAPVSGAFLPQVLKLDDQGAVDFDKGCYLGQEIVARAQFRGAVKRHLTHFQWHDDPPEIGKPTADVGTVVSWSADGQGLAVAKS